MKRCTICDRMLQLDEFHRDPKGRFRRNSQCRICRSAKWAAYFEDLARLDARNARQRAAYTLRRSRARFSYGPQ